MLYIYIIDRYRPKVVGEEVNIQYTTSPAARSRALLCLAGRPKDAGSERCQRAPVAQQRRAFGASVTRPWDRPPVETCRKPKKIMG